MSSVSARVRTPNKRSVVALLAGMVLPAVALVLAESAGLYSYLRLAVAGVVALSVGVTIFLRPRWGVYFMVFYVYAALNLYVGGGLFSMAIMSLILAGVVVGLVSGESWRLTDSVFLISAAVFTLLGLQSMMWAHGIEPAVEGYSKYLKAMAIVFLIVQTVRTPSQLKWLSRWVFIGAVATVFLGIVNSVFGISAAGETLTGTASVRFTGAHANPNVAAASMTSAIPMGVFVARSTKSIGVRLLAVLGILMIVVAVFATYSRQAFFALTFVAAAVLFKELRSRKAYAVIFTTLILGILITPRYYWLRFWTVTQLLETYQQDWSIYQRVMAFGRGWEMFKEHALTGVGLKNFAVRSGDVMYLRIPTHNMYLEVGVGLGLFGLLAYLTMFYSAIRQFLAGVRERWEKQDDWLRSLSYYLLVSVVSCLISGLFANIEFRHFLWILVGAGLALANLRREFRAG